MIRVLTMVDSLSPGIGGGELFAALVAMRLDRDHFERWLLTTRPSHGAFVEEVAAAGVRVVSLDRRRRLEPRAWARLVSLLRRERIDVLHAHKFGSNVWGAALGRAAGVPAIVAHEHSWSYEGRPLRRLLDRHVVARFADAFVAVSREDARRMASVEHVPERKIHFVPNGIDPPVRRGHDVRAELGIPPDTPIVVCVGRLWQEKRVDVLVRAAALLPAAVQVLVVGDGPAAGELNVLAGELGLDGRVRFLGRRDDVADVLAAADVAVNSSDREGSPLAVLEYMAAGKAIVATRVGGVPDLIDDGVHGLLVPRRDPGALAAAVSSLLDDPGRRRELGRRARDRQREGFALDATIRRLEELYVELLAGSARKLAIRAI